MRGLRGSHEDLRHPQKPDRVYFYYACAKRCECRDACPNRRSYRADALEPAVRRAVAGPLTDP